MTCPFTREPCGIREIGDGITMLPGMGVLVRAGVMVRVRINLRLWLRFAGQVPFLEVVQKCMAAKECTMDARKDLPFIALQAYLEEDGRIHATFIPCDAFDLKRCLYSHRLIVIQRGVKRWLERVRQGRRLAMAQVYERSPLNRIPIEVFLAHVVHI